MKRTASVRGNETAPLDLSVVICTRNRAATLGGTLAALARIQTSRSWEVLLVDNASTDETRSVIESADDCGGRLQYHRVDRIGLGAARDGAWRLARGKIVAFTDDDCYPEATYVDRILEVFEEHPEVGCVGGRILLYDRNDARVTIDEREEPENILPFRYVSTGVLHGANLSLRRSALERIGGFDPDLGAGSRFKSAEDSDVLAAALWAGIPARFDPRPVVWHHHRRRAKDAPRLQAGYHCGGGAYLAKYLLRPDTRIAFALGWWSEVKDYDSRANIERFTRELAFALAYLRSRRAYVFLVGFAPFAAAAYAAALVHTAVAACLRLAFRFTARRAAC